MSTTARAQADKISTDPQVKLLDLTKDIFKQEQEFRQTILDLHRVQTKKTEKVIEFLGNIILDIMQFALLTSESTDTRLLSAISDYSKGILALTNSNSIFFENIRIFLDMSGVQKSILLIAIKEIAKKLNVDQEVTSLECEALKNIGKNNNDKKEDKDNKDTKTGEVAINLAEHKQNREQIKLLSMNLAQKIINQLNEMMTQIYELESNVRTIVERLASYFTQVRSNMMKVLQISLDIAEENVIKKVIELIAQCRRSEKISLQPNFLGAFIQIAEVNNRFLNENLLAILERKYGQQVRELVRPAVKSTDTKAGKDIKDAKEPVQRPQQQGPAMINSSNAPGSTASATTTTSNSTSNANENAASSSATVTSASTPNSKNTRAASTG